MAKNYELGKVGQIVTVNATTNVLTFSTTSAVITPSGNVAQRPASPANGMIRYNTDYNKLENYANGAWANVGSVELVDSITNTSILYAPTANAVNHLNAIKANLSGATFSGTLGAAGTLNVSSNAVFTSEVTFDTTGSVKLPVGTTAQRPTGNNGLIRFNSNLGLAEVYSNSYSSWGPLLTAYSDVRQQFTASNNQTTFTVNYLVGAVDVYYNGIKLRNGSEVDVSSGSSVVLAAGAANNALIEVVGKGPSYVVSNTSQIVYQQYTASNNQTTFTVSGGYVPGMVDVYVEGIKLVNGIDVNVSSGNNIVLASGVPNNSLVEVRGVFTPINPSSTAGVRQTFVANSTVNNNFTVTGGYIPGFVDVYYNGSKLVNGSDVNVSSGTTVVLATNAAANAIVDVVGINYYTNAGGVTTPVRQSFTASANQSTFTVTGGYTPGMIDVYQNGVKLVNGADVNVSSGSSVVLATGAANNDTIDVVGFSAVSYQDAVKKSGDTMTNTLNIQTNVGVALDVYNPSDTSRIRARSSARVGVDLQQDSLGRAYVWNRDNNDLRFGANGTLVTTITPDGTFQFNSGFGSVATAYACRAWVNFNGATNAIRKSGNISSITDGGAGRWVINFANAMPDADYVVTIAAQQRDANDDRNIPGIAERKSTAVLRTASSIPIDTGSWLIGGYTATGPVEADLINVAIFR